MHIHVFKTANKYIVSGNPSHSLLKGFSNDIDEDSYIVDTLEEVITTAKNLIIKEFDHDKKYVVEEGKADENQN